MHLASSLLIPPFFGRMMTSKGWIQPPQGKLLNWLYEEAFEATKTATEDYDYSVAPESIEALEEEVLMIQLASAIFRVLQLRDRHHLSVVLTDEQGRSYLRYPDGRIEYTRQAKISGR